MSQDEEKVTWNWSRCREMFDGTLAILLRTKPLAEMVHRVSSVVPKANKERAGRDSLVQKAASCKLYLSSVGLPSARIDSQYSQSRAP